MKLDETRRVYSLIGVLGITLMFFLMFVSIAGANPYAYITNFGDNTVSVIDTATNKITATVPVGKWPWGVAVNPAGKVYVANSDGGTVSVIDTATDTVTATVPVRIPLGVAVTPDGEKVYVTMGDSSTVSVIDTSTNTVTAKVKVGTSPFGVAVNPDGTRVYVANEGSTTVSVIDTVSNKVTATVKVGSNPAGVAVNLDGTKVYVANGNSNNVSVIDTATNTVTATVNVVGPNGVAVSPDGTKVYVSSGNGISVIDTSTNTVTATVPVGVTPNGVAVTPDGRKVYVANYGSNNISVIDVATNTVTATVPVGKWPIAFGQFICYLQAEPVLPVADFSAKPTEGKAPLTVAFTDESIRSPTKWNWTFGDGASSTQQNPTHKYSKVGRYTVKLTATNNNSSNTVTKMDYVKVVTKPVANFTSSVTYGKAPITVAFNDTSTGIPTRWKWNFGDGKTSTIQNPTHKYSNAGNYTVSLTISNVVGGNMVTKTDYITVLARPVAAFSASPTSGKAPIMVAFNDTSTGSPIKWKWTFGDGTTSTQQNPTHKYSKVGRYTVTLTATNNNSSNTVTKTDYIKVVTKPVANFTSSVTSGKASFYVAFTDTSTGIPTGWNWNFGDGTTSTQQNPNHTYSHSGNYTVRLKASNIAGSNMITKADYIKVTK